MAVAISWIARPASSEVVAICREAAVTLAGGRADAPDDVAQVADELLNAWPSRSLFERGSTCTVRSPPATASATAAFSRR